MEKLPIFNHSHGITPLEKSQIFHFFNLLFLQSEKAFFFLEYFQTHFSWPISPMIKRWKNLSIFNQNLWRNPNFSTVLTCCFYGADRLLFFLEYSQTLHFLGYFSYIKKMEKLGIFNQYHGLTPLEKSQIFDFFNLLFLQCGKAFFLCRINIP